MWHTSTGSPAAAVSGGEVRRPLNPLTPASYLPFHELPVHLLSKHGSNGGAKKQRNVHLKLAG